MNNKNTESTFLYKLTLQFCAYHCLRQKHHFVTSYRDKAAQVATFLFLTTVHCLPLVQTITGYFGDPTKAPSDTSSLCQNAI